MFADTNVCEFAILIHFAILKLMISDEVLKYIKIASNNHTQHSKIIILNLIDLYQLTSTFKLLCF